MTSTKRRQNIRDELAKARGLYLEKIKRGDSKGVVRNGDLQFVFIVEGREVCEKAYVNLLGLADAKGHRTKMWCCQRDNFDDDCTFVIYIVVCAIMVEY